MAWPGVQESIDGHGLLARAQLRHAQAALLDTVARDRETLEQARVYAAYRQLAENVDFQTLRTYWIQRYMLTPILTDEQRGHYNFLVQMFTEMRAAGASVRAGALP